MSQDFNEAPAQKSNVVLLIVLGGCGCAVTFFVIIGILIALLLPAVNGAREAARRMQCSNHMKQIGLALYNYHDAYKSLPPAYTTDEDGNPLHSWRVLILPYLEQQYLYDQIRLDEPWDSEYNSQFHTRMPGVYRCTSTATENGMATYSVVVGEETVFHGDTTYTIGDIEDGNFNTIFLVERKTPVCWMDPFQEITFEEACKGVNVSEDGIGSPHPGGVNVCIFDGSVSFISDTIHPDTLRALFTRAGGESIPIP